MAAVEEEVCVRCSGLGRVKRVEGDSDEDGGVRPCLFRLAIMEGKNWNVVGRGPGTIAGGWSDGGIDAC